MRFFKRTINLHEKWLQWGHVLAADNTNCTQPQIHKCAGAQIRNLFYPLEQGCITGGPGATCSPRCPSVQPSGHRHCLPCPLT
ncbi:hypothetical protein GDO78_005372 [Eleutherodactylus coqui]|uniref:Uncharacterized protein n=1 Tax=Eleutherodactylus coqui TaxID=57060 RepID=A0A8J6FMI0_ELECQ|nr:hypothetical protein GDO78_005372 [Eleutherodactylus coqui]